jgi:hypothetical protein
MVLAADAHAQSRLPLLQNEENSLLEKCKPFIVRYHELNGFWLTAGYSVVESLKGNAALY